MPTPPTTAPPPERRLAADDIALALVLLVAGVLGIGIGVAGDRPMQLTLGLILTVLSAHVAWEAYRPSRR